MTTAHARRLAAAEELRDACTDPLFNTSPTVLALRTIQRGDREFAVIATHARDTVRDLIASIPGVPAGDVAGNVLGFFDSDEAFTAEQLNDRLTADPRVRAAVVEAIGEYVQEWWTAVQEWTRLHQSGRSVPARTLSQGDVIRVNGGEPLLIEAIDYLRTGGKEITEVAVEVYPTGVDAADHDMPLALTFLPDVLVTLVQS